MKLFENGGRGIGEKGKDNGMLVLLALKERRVWIEVGYGLEEIVTDGYSGETSRQVMVPLLPAGRLRRRTRSRRDAARRPHRRSPSGHARGVPRPAPTDVGAASIAMNEVILLFVLVIFVIRIRMRWVAAAGAAGAAGGVERVVERCRAVRRRRVRWRLGIGGGGGWRGFGGFGGGRSGGGGGGASW